MILKGFFSFFIFLLRDIVVSLNKAVYWIYHTYLRGYVNIILDMVNIGIKAGLWMLKLRSRCVIVFVFQYLSLFHYRLSGLIGPISNDIGFFSFFVPESPIRLILFTDKKKSVIFFFLSEFPHWEFWPSLFRQPAARLSTYPFLWKWSTFQQRPSVCGSEHSC